MAEAYIVAAKRTAGARKGGRLKGWHPVDLSAVVIDALVADDQAAVVDDVILGCVMQVGEQAINVARNAVLASKLPQSVPGTSVDRQCGSSQQALHFAAQAVMAGAMDVVIAGGVESMTRVPMGLSVTLPAQNDFGMYMSPKLHERFGSAPFSQFLGAEMMVEKYKLMKIELDQFSYESHVKAAQACRSGAFADEIVPLTIMLDDGSVVEHDCDEGIRHDADLEAIRAVKLLKEGGALTAASSSQICDGASAVLVANEAGLKKLGAKPLARIHHMTVMGGDPVIMLETPIAATRQALKKTGLGNSQID